MFDCIFETLSAVYLPCVGKGVKNNYKKFAIFSSTIRRIRVLIKVFVQASIYPYNLHTPRPMIFKLGMDIIHSKLVMPN